MAAKDLAGSAPAAGAAGVPADAEAELVRARALLAAGTAAEAVPILQRMAEQGPPRLAVWLTLAEALLVIGDFERADPLLRRMRQAGATGEALDTLGRRYRALLRERCGVRLLGAPVVTPGWPADRAQPALIARLRIVCPPRLDVDALERRLAEGFGMAMPPAAATAGGMAERVADLTLRLVVALQQAASLPAFDEGRLLCGTEPGEYMLFAPAGDEAAAVVAMNAAASVVGRFLAAGSRPADWQVAQDRFAEGAGQLLERLRHAASPTGNGVHYLRAAHRMGVPWRRYGGHVFQIGQGVHARWLDSSLTDRTPSVGVTMAQNKMVTATILRRAGLPAPPHGRAPTIEAARMVAARLGYPVVVKPANRDGGIGVAAGLEDEAALARAFAAARELAEEVLVEKHVDGDDYRLVVMDGRVTWAIERVPGGVRGDGRSTLAELLAALNADPRRGDGKSASLQRVDWDEEAAHLAARQGLTLEAVPAAGRFVRLRRITNVARGGMPVPFPLERVHPENIRLAIRAADALRLDLAGIDFITPDIGRPWHEVGGAINEVNARPSLGLITAGHLFGEIVDWLLGGGDGRIPIVAVVGDADELAEPLARRIHGMLVERGLVAGLAVGAGAWVGSQQVAWDDRRGEAGGALLLTDRKVEAAVLAMPLAGLDVAGAPFDRCSVLVRLGGAGPPDLFESGLAGRATDAIVAPAGEIARLDGFGTARRIPVVLDGADRSMRIERLAAAVAEGLAATDGKHR